MIPKSIWKCPKCSSAAAITFAEMADIGTPLCNNEECENRDGELMVDTIPSNKRKPLTPRHFLKVRDRGSAITPMPILGHYKSGKGRGKDRVHGYQAAMDERNFALDQMTYAILIAQGYRIPKAPGGDARVLSYSALHPHAKRLAIVIGQQAGNQPGPKETVWIIWGEQYAGEYDRWVASGNLAAAKVIFHEHASKYTFDTLAEMSAFLKGVSEGRDSSDWTQIDIPPGQTAPGAEDAPPTQVQRHTQHRGGSRRRIPHA